MNAHQRMVKAINHLAPRARQVLAHIEKAGSISARDAAVDIGISDASLSRRICDLEAAGIGIKRERKKHPVSGIQYTRYSLAPQEGTSE